MGSRPTPRKSLNQLSFSTPPQIVGQLMDADRKKMQYEGLTTNLLSWIRQKTLELEQRDLPNSLEGIQRELLAFKEYRTIEKPPK